MMDATTRMALSAMISNAAGFSFPEAHSADLDRGVRNACDELKIDDPGQFIHRVLKRGSDPQLLECLINHLTIGETYFFREKPVLEAFTGQLLPAFEKSQNGREKILNIWCAGCCTGEEPYTIAILLREHLRDIQNWKIRIDATDINQNFLNKASEGVYSAWSFRETPDPLRRKYFSQHEKQFAIDPEIRNMVIFSRLNLVGAQPALHGIYPDQTHFIFCRNVLMYFTADHIHRIYETFNHTLTKDGWLITSSVELPKDTPRGFIFKRTAGVTLLQKGTEIKQVQEAAPSPKAEKNHKIKEHPEQGRKKKATSTRPAATPVNKPEPPVREATTLSHARRAFQNNAYEEVLHLFERDQVSAQTGEGIFLQIRSLANLGQLGKAEQMLAQLIETTPPNSTHFYLQGSIFFEQGAYQKAEEALRKALYLAPDMVLAHLLIGSLLQKKGEHDRARKHYQNIQKLIGQLADGAEIPDSDGITAGYVRSSLESLLKQTA